MTSFRRFVVIVLALILCSHIADAAQPTCTDTEARRALDGVDSLRTWDALYKSYAAYRQCDDGAIGEGYSDAVARILANRWDTLPRLAHLASKDAEFRRFVLRHVDATDNTSDLQKILTRVRTACPAGLRKLCDDLGEAATAALKESGFEAKTR